MLVLGKRPRGHAPYEPIKEVGQWPGVAIRPIKTFWTRRRTALQLALPAIARYRLRSEWLLASHSNDLEAEREMTSQILERLQIHVTRYKTRAKALLNKHLLVIPYGFVSIEYALVGNRLTATLIGAEVGQLPLCVSEIHGKRSSRLQSVIEAIAESEVKLAMLQNQDRN